MFTRQTRAPQTPQEVWDLYEIDIRPALAAVPRTWRDWCRVPRTSDARWLVSEAFIGHWGGTPGPVLLWLVLGALLAHDGKDARSFAGSLCERVPGLFHGYCRVRRALEPLQVVRYLLCLLHPTSHHRAWGRAMLGLVVIDWRFRLETLRLDMRRLRLPLAGEDRPPPTAPFVLLLAACWPVLWWLLTAGQ